MPVTEPLGPLSSQLGGLETPFNWVKLHSRQKASFIIVGLINGSSGSNLIITSSVHSIHISIYTYVSTRK